MKSLTSKNYAIWREEKRFIYFAIKNGGGLLCKDLWVTLTTKKNDIDFDLLATKYKSTPGKYWRIDKEIIDFRKKEN